MNDRYNQMSLEELMYYAEHGYAFVIRYGEITDAYREEEFY